MSQNFLHQWRMPTSFSKVFVDPVHSKSYVEVGLVISYFFMSLLKTWTPMQFVFFVCKYWIIWIAKFCTRRRIHFVVSLTVAFNSEMDPFCEMETQRQNGTTRSSNLLCMDLNCYYRAEVNIKAVSNQRNMTFLKRTNFNQILIDYL